MIKNISPNQKAYTKIKDNMARTQPQKPKPLWNIEKYPKYVPKSNIWIIPKNSSLIPCQIPLNMEVIKVKNQFKKASIQICLQIKTWVKT